MEDIQPEMIRHCDYSVPRLMIAAHKFLRLYSSAGTDGWGMQMELLYIP